MFSCYDCCAVKYRPQSGGIQHERSSGNAAADAAGRHLEPRPGAFPGRVRSRLHHRDLPRELLPGRGPSRGRRGRRGKPHRIGAGHRREGPGREPERASPVARVLRRRAHAADHVRLDPHRSLRRRGDDRRRPDDPRDDASGEGQGPAQRAGGRSLRGRALRAPARGRGRPHEVRTELEQPTAEREARTRQRGHADRGPRPGQGVAMKVLGISGSLRRESHNRKLLLAAREFLPAGVELELWDGLKAVPPYDEDDDGDLAPAAVAQLRAAIAGADAILFATPEYNASVPGQLKNAVDWASRPRGKAALLNKPVVVVGASTGMYGAVWAQAELRKALGTAGARVVDAEVAIGRARTQFDGE